MSLRNMCDTAEAQEVRRTLARIGDKWSLLVITLLGHRTMRFSEIRREVDDISQRMLTLTLRNLERDGLVHRTIYPSVPPKVEYRLTPLGETLLETMQALVTWTVANLDAISDARIAYDERSGAPNLAETGD